MSSKTVPRLLPSVVDEIADAEPTRPFSYHPRSTRPQDGWVPVTFKEFSNAINHVAHVIFETVRESSEEEFPTIGYIGPSDLRYGILVLAAIKAGCKALFISPRNNIQCQLSLFEETNCNHLWYADTFHLMAQSWLLHRKMRAWTVPSVMEWIQTPPSPFPYEKSFEEARWDPLVVLHTSGSTGMPKPVVVRQGGFAVGDSFRDLPDYMGGPFLWKSWQSTATKVFMPMPLFHAGGLLAGMLLMSVYYGLPVVLPLPDKPVTADLTIECLKYSGADGALLAPSTLEELSLMSEGVEVLKNLGFVAWGGGSISKTAGSTLIGHGVALTNAIASTELLPYPIHFQSNAELWQYFIINSDAMGAEWLPHDHENRIYELVVRRKDVKEPLDQPAFYTFPDRTDWSTGDLFQAHPTLEDHWVYYGRADNIIVFSNGEKLNPVTIEENLMEHPAIRGALVVGQGRFQPALILEPSIQPKTAEDSRLLIETVWPLVEQLNKDTVAHGRISKDLIALSDPEMPFPRASKGTVQRGLAIRVYGQRIDEIYEQAEVVDMTKVNALKLATEDSTLQSIMELLQERIGVKEIEPCTEFFSAGIDSLQVLSLSKLLSSGVNAAGFSVGNAIVAPKAIYANPTPESLAKYLHTATHGNDIQQAGGDTNAVLALESLVAKYTKDLPTAQPEKLKPLEDGQTILLTGSTGSLGAYLLNELCKLPHVKAVIALNRGTDGGRSRQHHVSLGRGLGTDFSKVEFLGADLSLPNLGLPTAKYEQILHSVDRIIHNAWPVNFNISLASFEPHIRGVRNLVNFSSAASKQVPIIFLSSISTIGNWKLPTMVPEERLNDLSLPQMGYGQSKLAGSLILDAAAEESGMPCASIRVGQIAGPRGDKGKWNPQEFLPSLIASSVHLGVLPHELGPHNVVDWIPIEDVSSVVLDISGITQPKDVSDICGYFNCVNPNKSQWPDMAKVIQDFYGERIRELVGLDDWVAKLRSSATGSIDVLRNPAVKLTDTYQAMLDAHRAGREPVELEMVRTIGQSSTAARLGQVTADLMRNWCAQWRF